MFSFLGVLLACLIWYSPFFLEAAVILAVLYWAIHSPPVGTSRWLAIERRVARFARRRRLAVVTVGLAALAGRAALLPILPLREPLISDESSYLLAADTFASGPPSIVHLTASIGAVVSSSLCRSSPGTRAAGTGRDP